ncbi:MAG: ribonuclease P protein component [Firmicutes bacterium]|nr:ribonuclease P protein component [Bacillota bacterium]
MLKNNVLRKKSDFDSIYNRGKSVGDRYIVLFYRKNDLPYNRTGFLASKKVGNSVQRNRARRLMKESYRHLQSRLPIGYDFIIIARNTISGKKCMEVERSLMSAFKRTGVIKK